MAVRPDPEEREVEHRVAELALVVGCRALLAELAFDPVDSGGRAKAVEQCAFRERVVRQIVAWRDAPLVAPPELDVAPVGLALISRLAPPRVLSLMMGLWFAATFPGDVLGGWLGGFWSTMEKASFFLMIGTIAGLAGAAVLALNPALRSVFDERPDDTP